jgi:hypothetical protein
METVTNPPPLPMDEASSSLSSVSSNEAEDAKLSSNSNTDTDHPVIPTQPPCFAPRASCNTVTTGVFTAGSNDVEDEDDVDIHNDKDKTIESSTQEHEQGRPEEEAHATTNNNDTDTINNDTDTSIQSPFLGWYQILALIHKNLLTKYRTPLATFMELFSPVLIMLVLVAAYQLSSVTYKDAQTYATIRVQVPGPWLDLVRGIATVQGVPEAVPSAGGDLDQQRLRRLLLVNEEEEDEENYLFTKRLGFQKWPEPDDIRAMLQSHRLGRQAQRQRRRVQLAGQVDDEIDDDDLNIDLDDQDDIYIVLNDARKQLSRLLKNPIPVPSFTEYVNLSRFLSSVFDTDDLPRIFSDSSYGREWGNLLTLGTLHLSPDTTRTRDFWEYLNETYPSIMNNNNSSNDESILTVRLHETEQEAVRFIGDNLDERTWALLDFASWPDDNNNDNNVKFKIRMNYTTLPNTNEITDFVSIGLNKDYQRYYLSGFLTLQRTLNEFAFVRQDGDGTCINLVASNVTSDIWSMPMPTASYSQNTFYLAVGYLLGLTIVMAYLYPTSRLIKSMVEEKETRMKETLFILGVRPWAHWWSWLISSLLVFFIISVLLTQALSVNVLGKSSKTYLFVFIWLFSTASIGFCFTIASLFSRAKLASIVGPMSLFVTILPRFIFFGYNRYEATTSKMWASLLPATAFAFGADIIADYEYAEQGIQSWNAGEGDYSFNTALGFLFFDTILYISLAWYLEQVIPREFGSARPFYFLCSPRYWCNCSFRNRKSDHDEAHNGENSESPHPDFKGDDRYVLRICAGCGRIYAGCG